MSTRDLLPFVDTISVCPTFFFRFSFTQTNKHRPPTWTAMFDGVTGSKGVREKLPSGTISNTQWRRAGVKYSNNECFVDIEEKMDFIVDKKG